MAGKKAKTAAAGKLIRKHHCPICPAQEDGSREPMAVVMKMPGRKISFHCAKGHEVRKGQTILI